jgi:outer membrane lipoprotein-sorting protein
MKIVNQQMTLLFSAIPGAFSGAFSGALSRLRSAPATVRCGLCLFRSAGMGLLLFCWLPAVPAFADDIARAEAWFNKIKTLSADFVQVASDGTAAEGKLIFRRPSQMKLIYGKGDTLKLITSSIWLHVDRPDERLLTSYPLSETPLSLILDEKVSLRPDGYETRNLPSSAGIIRIEVTKDDGEGAGRLTLEFSDKPFQFRRWVILDAAGIETSVTLQNMVFDQPVANDVFQLPQYNDQ